MKICRVPFRIPLAGGGTDLPFYYKIKGGNFISMSIQEYMFVYISKRPFDNRTMIQTTTCDFYKENSSIKNRLIRETLKYFKIKENLHIGTFTTLPTRSGIGSSSCLVVGLITLIDSEYNLKLNRDDIIKIAFNIERKILKLDGGWQDQIMAVHGGLKEVKISKNGKFKVSNIKKHPKIKKLINKKMILIFSKETRNSNEIIKSQEKNSDKIKLYDELKMFTPKIKTYLKKGDFSKIGNLFHFHWEVKKKLSNQISNNKLNKMYDKLMESKFFFGGKIMGAGGGGFFVMICKDLNNSLRYLTKKKYKFSKIKFEDSGSKILEVNKI